MSEGILDPEGYSKRHTAAFRCAFDFLNSHFPPGQELDWWEQAAKDVNEASVSQEENKLAIGLLSGVYDYLESEWKLRRKEHGETDD